jgi:protocatechuate 3,4-dioxygenase beta subunit
LRYKVPELSVLVLICSLSLLAPLSATATSAAAIAGASVEASGPGYGVATVTAGGGYTIAGLYAAGGYNVSARAVGFVEAYHSTLAAVTLGQVTSGVDFTLMRSSIVTGKVTGPTGAPVAGATVTLEDNTTAVEAGSDVTTSDGVYAIETGVAAGVYKIEVTPPYGTSLLGISCSSFLSLCPDDSAQVPGFLPMTVASVSVGAQATVTKNIQLAASAAVEGKVTFDGVGVSGVVVSTNASCFCYSVTNSTGWYVLFSSLPTGNYRVTLSPPLASVLSAHVIAAGSAVVHATAGLVTRQDFSVSASAVISGYVKDQHGNAVAGAVVDTGTESCAYGHCFMTCDDSGLSCATNTTDASGHYTLETGIAAGSYNVTATKGSAKAGLSPLIPVTAGATVNAPQITLNLAAQAVARITGTVKDSHGSPLAGAYVSGEGIGCSCGADNATDSMGQFVLEIAVPSTVPVNVSASSTGYTGAFTIVPGVSAGGAYSAGTLSLTAIPAASISGTVQGQILSTFIQPMRV